MTRAGLAPRVVAVRRFNRFYTRQIGLLNEGFLQSRFSLTQVRILYELAHGHGPTATDLVDALGIDAGYLSRTLKALAGQGLVARERSASDGRRAHLSLTPRGKQRFAVLEARQRREVAALLERLPARGQQRLVGGMRAVEEALAGRPEPEGAPYRLRGPRPGDMGWVVHRHGALYAQEYGWNAEFEGLVAEIVVKFVRSYDPRRERCWIAERDGEIAGFVFLVKKSATVAQLRMLIVEPWARGLGLGRRLVHECTVFARAKGYRKITLWTQSNLVAARGIYRKEGYRMVHSAQHHSFGHDLTEEVWDLEL
jgi:DNA-binding MarR family transcriptional regulator/N-acetylglutamate synthase-like GNAT family acetyltransferase